MLQDEKDTKEKEAIEAFLKEYKALCDKHGCMVISFGREVEVFYAPDDLRANHIPHVHVNTGIEDYSSRPPGELAYWGVELTTAERYGWNQ